MKKLTSPWAWIPTLYFAEGIPYVAVMTISVILYKQMGLSNADITFYTSWLYPRQSAHGCPLSRDPVPYRYRAISRHAWPGLHSSPAPPP